MKLTTRVQAISKKVTLITTAFVLAVSTMATALPFMAAEQASAAGAVAVTPDAMAGWQKYGGATHEFVPSADAPLGAGALKLSASTSGQYGMIWKDLSSTSMKALDISMSYASKRLSGPAHAAPAFALVVDKDGLSDTYDRFYAIYEPVYNNSGANYDNWNTWSVSATSKFRHTTAWDTPPAEGTLSYTTPLNASLINYPNATVVATVLNIGTGNSGWSFLVDKVSNGEATYDFELTASPTPVVQSITPGIGSFISGDAQKVYVNIENPEAMRGGFLMLNKAVETGAPLNSDRETYPLQEDGDGWYALVDTTALISGADYLVKVEAHGTQTPWGYYGNGSAWLSPSYALTVDNTGPTMTSVKINGKTATIAPRATNCGPTAFNRVHGKVSLTATINDGTGVGVGSASYKIRKVTDGGCTQASVYTSSSVAMQSGAGDEWVTLPGAGLDTTLVPANGNYTIMVTSKDTFNNPTIQYVDITVDNERPAAEIDAPALTNENNPLIKGIASDNMGIKGHWFEVKAPNGNLYYVNTFLGSSAGEVSFNLSEAKGTVGGVANTPIDLEDGEYKIRYVVTDITGNRSDDPAYTNSVIHTLVIDSTAPGVAIPSYTTAGNVITPTVMNDDSTASFLWTPAASNPAVVAISDPTVQTPTFTATTTGVYVFNLTATDDAGNSTVTPFSFTYTAPVAAIATPVLLDEEEDDDTTTPPITGFSNVFGNSTTIPEAETEPEEDVQGAADVAGSSTEDNLAAAVDTDGTDGTVFGLAWYWWLLILGVLAGIIWWIIAALRGRQTEA